MKWRLAGVGLTLLLLGFLAFANFVPEKTRLESPLLPDRGMRLGLDLQGGIHWVLGVKLSEALHHELNFLGGNLKRRFEDEKVAATVTVEGQELVVRPGKPSDRDRVRELVEDTAVLREVGEESGAMRFVITDRWQKEVRNRAMQQVLEVLRNRLSDPATGILESVVTRQGQDRVLVQIPGGEVDREKAAALLDVTGFLEFKLVYDQAASSELLRAKYPDGLPPDRVIASQYDKETGREVMAYLVDKEPDLTGDYLADARVGFDNRQRPIVNFEFTSQGGERFGALTEANIGRQLAIILDNKVYSAPVIQSRISMRGQIEGRFTAQEAADLAVVLRAGSLSVPVAIEEERTVGPALGADSIRRGLNASVLGLLAVVAFAIVYYRISGAIASFALVANLVMIIGLMSLPDISATLTLPGIAGLVLTVGMAIDANVIIFERIREELRAGKVPRAAVETGFGKATWTILDANITTLITALVLYQYGTGPIKGFAVTLSIGILTSVFAALVISRLLFDLWLGDRRVEKLSI